MVYEVRDDLLMNIEKEEKETVDIGSLLKLAKGVTRNNNNFSQIDTAYNAQTMNVLAVDLLTAFKSGRIKIRIVRLKKGGTIYLGAIRRDYFEGLNYKAPQPWNGGNSVGKVHFYNNQSMVYGQTTSQLKTFSEGSNMEISMNGDTMKIAMKKNSAEFKLAGG